MKLRILLMLLFLWGITFASYPQKVTMKFEKVKLEKIFSTIEQQTGLTVSYDQSTVDPSEIVSVQAV